MRPLLATAVAVVLVASQAPAFAGLVSDGSDGAFHPTASQTVDLPPDGVFNFSTIDIPAGVTIRFRKNSVDSPAYLLATGAVTIAGVIDVSAGGVNLADLANPGLGYLRPATTTAGGPGGGAGGAAGFGDTSCTGSSCKTAQAGNGPSPGSPGWTPSHGDSVKVFGVAGGGGGMATAGLTEHWSNIAGASGGNGVAYPVPLSGGSGGGGGSGWYFFGVQLGGGAGGGGGGALLVSTPDAISVSGSLLALGGNGGWAFANAGGLGGPGGGGSGGNIALIGTSVTLQATALVDATGGYGGGVSTQPYPNDPRNFEDGARGGTGYLYVAAAGITLGGTLNASVVAVPEPQTFGLMAVGLAMLGVGVRRRRR